MEFKRSYTKKPDCHVADVHVFLHEKDGKVQPFHMTHYISRAVGQVGLIMVEATAVTPQGRISDQDLGIWDDAHIDGLAALTSQIKTYGSKTAIQLAHAGRKAEVEGTIVRTFSDSFRRKFANAC